MEEFQSVISFIRNIKLEEYKIPYKTVSTEVSLGDSYCQNRKEIIPNSGAPITEDDFIRCTLDRQPHMIVHYSEDSTKAYKQILLTNYTEVHELKDDFIFKSSRIDNKSSTNIIASIHYGCWTSIEVATDKLNRELLNQIQQTFANKLFDKQNRDLQTCKRFKIITQKSKQSSASDFPEGILISVKANCRGIPNIENEPLNKKTFDRITDIDYITVLNNGILEARPMYISVIPTDIEHFFEPLILKIQDVINSTVNVDNREVVEMTNFIMKLILQKIKETSALIRDNTDSRKQITFLQNIYKSNIINIQCIEKFLKTLFERQKSDRESRSKRLLPSTSTKRNFVVEIYLAAEEISSEEIRAELLREFIGNLALNDYETALQCILTRDREKEINLPKEFEKVIELQKCNQEKEKEVHFEIVHSSNVKNGLEIKYFKNGTEFDSRLPLLEGPKHIRQVQCGKDFITITWDQPITTRDYNVVSYLVQYRKVDDLGNPLSEWENCYTSQIDSVKKIDELAMKCRYVFRVQTIYADVVSVYGEQSDPIQTKNSLKEKIIEELSPIKNSDGSVSNPAVYQLPLKDKIIVNKPKIRICYYGDKYDDGNDQRTMIVLGATGSGKSTFINGLVNFIFNVDYSDNFRLKLFSDEANKSQSQTEWITNYQIPKLTGARVDYTINIIHTPGFGDISGIQRDQQIFDQIKELFNTKLQLLHAVCIVIPNSYVRLIPTQKYILDIILSIFGKDIKDNIFVLVTFGDGTQPPVIETLKEATVPFSDYFVFNNSALYTSNDEKISFNFTRMFWNIGAEGFKIFTKRLKETQPASLQLTKEVLHVRECLETVSTDYTTEKQKKLEVIERIRQQTSQLEDLKLKSESSEHYTYTVQETKFIKVDLDPGTYLINCLVCNHTCHDSHKSGDIRKTSIMNNNGYCTVCPGKCYWNNHCNMPYRFEIKTFPVTKEYAAMREKYDRCNAEMKNVEKFICELENKNQTLDQSIATQEDQLRHYMKKLNNIALNNPFNSNLIDYIDILIKSETEHKSSGSEQRICELKKIRNRTEIIVQFVK